MTLTSSRRAIAQIVVRQHDHRPSLQPGLEDAFAGDVEVVAVDEGELEGGAGHRERAGVLCINSVQMSGGLSCAVLFAVTARSVPPWK
jgi:hypothetical protein